MKSTFGLSIITILPVPTKNECISKGVTLMFVTHVSSVSIDMERLISILLCHRFVAIVVARVDIGVDHVCTRTTCFYNVFPPQLQISSATFDL